MDGSDEVCSLTSEGVWELTDPNLKINDYGIDFGYSFVKPKGSIR